MRKEVGPCRHETEERGRWVSGGREKAIGTRWHCLMVQSLSLSQWWTYDFYIWCGITKFSCTILSNVYIIV